uniref:Glutamyl-tRNA(Gln) amidotransferase subunit C (Glu-ADT subunit C) n=1 Tax=mine drainage metagenome TaxID=410659 RepID=E6PYP5_9ZZZZ
MSAEVTIAEVERVAELANLELAADEKPRMQRDLNAMLGYVAQLEEIDTTGVEPLAQVSDLFAAGADVVNTSVANFDAGDGAQLRADVVARSLDRAGVMAAAPETDGAFFKTPKVIER